MDLKFSLFSSFASFVSPDVNVVDLFHSVPLSDRVIKKKLCSGGFKKTLISLPETPGCKNDPCADTSRATFVEFKLKELNAVVGFYKNGKIRVAGKMVQGLDIAGFGSRVLIDVLGIDKKTTVFRVNNITGMFQSNRSLDSELIQGVFCRVSSDIRFPSGEIPPYTVTRIVLQDWPHTMVNYTPNSGAFQILGCKSLSEIHLIHKMLMDLIDAHKGLFQDRKGGCSLNKFEKVGMKKQGRGRPTFAFMEEYKRRLLLLENGKATLGGEGVFVECSS